MGKIKQVSSDMKELLKTKSAFSLPDNPSAAGWKAIDIRKTLYKPISDTANSAISEIERVIKEANALFDISLANIDIVEGIKGVYYMGTSGYAYTLDTLTKSACFAGSTVNGTELRIPDRIYYEGTEFTVTCVAADALSPENPFYSGTYTFERIIVPATVGNIKARAFSVIPSLRYARFEGSSELAQNVFSYPYAMSFSVPKQYYEKYMTMLPNAKTIECFDSVYGNAKEIETLKERFSEMGVERIEYIGTDDDGGNMYRLYYNTGRTTTMTAPKGDIGIGIKDIMPYTSSAEGNVYKITLSNDQAYYFTAPTGKSGTGFKISKTYASVSDMENAYSSDEVPLYGFALISSDVEDENNAKLYVKEEAGYRYLCDLSGAQGIKGDTPQKGTDYFTAYEISEIKTQILNSAFPIGHIYISTVNSSPASFIGGSWSKIKDRFLLAAGSTYIAGSQGGSTSHTHTLDSGYAKLVVADLSSTALSGHGIAATNKNDVSWTADRGVKTNNLTYSMNFNATSATALGGNSDESNSLPPYLTVYMWKRVS